MVSTKEIQATCDDIVREFAPQQVILFGSYAYGTPTEASDVDLFVEVRYETFATAADVEHAVRICTEVRTAIRTVLQLPNDAQVEKSLFRQRTVRSLMSIEE